MLDVKKIRKDFPMYRNDIKMQNKPLVWLDNASTTFKPDCVLNAIKDYYENHTSNTHRGDYDLLYNNDLLISKTRETVATFINCEPKEVVFTYGTTSSLNLIAYGYAFKFLNKGDEILITEAEHASNVLPWFRICELKGCVVKYIPLDDKGRITIDNFKKSLTNKTKLISLAYVTNVLGYTAPIKEICKIAHEKNIIVSVDGAQSVPHMKTDVKDLDCDFLSFSGHKLCGPTGVGVLYGKYDILQKMDPFMTGGGMNSKFYPDGTAKYYDAPNKFEAGTINIEGIIGLKSAIEYISSIGMDEINKYEHELKSYAVEKLSLLPNITIYNKESEASIVDFNIEGVFSQDLASLLNHKGIAVRSGQHCAKLLNSFLGTPATARASFYFYTSKEDIDCLYESLKTGGDFLDAFFN